MELLFQNPQIAMTTILTNLQLSDTGPFRPEYNRLLLDILMLLLDKIPFPSLPILLFPELLRTLLRPDLLLPQLSLLLQHLMLPFPLTLS